VHKNFRTGLHEIFSEGWGPVNKRLNFGDNPDHRLDRGIVFGIRYYWEIRKLINGHSFMLIRRMAAHTGKM